jgi:hypothetical protein
LTVVVFVVVVVGVLEGTFTVTVSASVPEFALIFTLCGAAGCAVSVVVVVVRPTLVAGAGVSVVTVWRVVVISSTIVLSFL